MFVCVCVFEHISGPALRFSRARARALSRSTRTLSYIAGVGSRLDNTLLEELPSLLGKLVKLRGFSAVQNKLVNLPEEFGKMVSLTKINLDSNGLRSLPESLGNLKNLRDISLTRNRIGWLPGSIRNLAKVEEMRLSFNRHKFSKTTLYK